ncbi:MAG: hypothetical protein ACK5JI_09510 [Azonexus sp.]
MTITQVFYTSRKLAESLEGNPYMAVISITDPTTPEANLDPLFRHVLRLSFFDAVPADQFMPLLPGLFNRSFAGQIDTFVSKLHCAPFELSLMVHCEYGVSRSAAIALFAAAATGASLTAREFAYEANPWVIETLENQRPDLHIEIPSREAANERRVAQRA